MKFNTPNLLQGLVRCKKCKVGLLVKDSTPAHSPRRYVHYLCPSCGQKIETAMLDEVVLTQIGREWPGQIGVFKNEARKTLLRWEKELLKAQRQAQAELEEARYQRATLSSSSPHAEMWEKIISLRENVATQRLQSVLSIQEKVSTLSQTSMFDEWIQRFAEPNWIRVLNHTEIRTFCFFVIQHVEVELAAVTKVSICFRLSPFVTLANSIGCLTELASDTVGKKPKERRGA